MTLLTNRGFQVFIIVLAAIGAVTALLVTNTINQTTGVGMLSTVVGLGLGVPLSPSQSVATAPAPVVPMPPQGG